MRFLNLGLFIHTFYKGYSHESQNIFGFNLVNQDQQTTSASFKYQMLPSEDHKGTPYVLKWEKYQKTPKPIALMSI